MKLTVINSGSSGNTYLLEVENEILILDCGCSLMDVKKALKFDLSRIVGCISSHGHLDHSKYEKDYTTIGLELFAPYKTSPIRANKQMGGYYLQAFHLPHGETENYGFLIRHKNGETILYCTDFSYCQYNFKACKVNHFLTEVNYQKEYVDFDAPNFKHKVADHCSLDTCMKFIADNITPSIKSVIALHLGIGSTDENEIADAIQSVVGDTIFVDIATAGKVFEV